MSTVTFKTRTQIGEKAYEVGEVAALTARLEAYVLERGLAAPGGELPGPDVVEVDFPQPPSENPETEAAPEGGGEKEEDGEEEDVGAAEGEGAGASPATGTASSPATGSQPQPPQAPAKKTVPAKKTAHKR